MFKNTGKGSNLSFPKPGTALKDPGNSFVLGKGIGKVLASHWLRLQLISNSSGRKTLQTPVIPNSIIHVLWSAPGTPSNDSHECQGTESGNASHISGELQGDVKKKKKRKTWISLQLGIKPGLRVGIKGLERQGEGNQHNGKQQWEFPKGREES